MIDMISAGINKDLRRKIYRRECYECALCGDRRHLTAHHVVFRSQGGPDTEMNLIALCPRCHALCHGHDIDGIGRSQEDMEQAVVEYLSDLYAQEGVVWNPWSAKEVHWPW